MTPAVDAYVTVSPGSIFRSGYGLAVSSVYSGCGTARCSCSTEFPLSGRDIAQRCRCILHPRSDSSVGAMLSASGLIGNSDIIDSSVVTA